MIPTGGGKPRTLLLFTPYGRGFPERRQRFTTLHVVMLLIEALCPAPELKGKSGPDGCVAPVGIQVPTAAAGHPDGALHASLYLCIECFLHFWPHINGLQVLPIHLAQAIQDIS